MKAKAPQLLEAELEGRTIERTRGSDDGNRVAGAQRRWFAHGSGGLQVARHLLGNRCMGVEPDRRA